MTYGSRSSLRQASTTRLNNFAVQYAQGEILALLNNDVEVIAKEWLQDG